MGKKDAKVKITTTDGKVREVEINDQEDGEFYDNLPFRTESVMRTEITPLDT